MKFSLQLIIALLIPTCLFGTNVSLQVETDSCSPVYESIYNFGVNDLFQYRSRSTSSAGGASPTYEQVTQYTILDKYTDSTSTEYAVEGWIQNMFYYNESSNIDVSLDTSTDSDYFYDYFIYIDTVSNFLNQCPKDLVKIDYEMFEELGIGEVYSKVLIYNHDSSHMVKAVGGENNLFIYNQQSELEPLNDVFYKAVYSPGLGMISQEFTFLEMHETVTLEAYVIGDDTTGTILENDDYYHATNIASTINQSENSLDIYPNPGNGLISANLTDITEVKVYDLLGKLVYSAVNTNNLDITHLKKGTYIIQVINSGRQYKQKYILY